MSSLFVELGQCGCQIGQVLNPKLANSYYCTRNGLNRKLHAIMIDTEPKVLQPLLKKPPRWLDPTNVKFLQSGRGNNWSYGYMQELNSQANKPQKSTLDQFSRPTQNDQLPFYIQENRAICDYALEKIRKELESTDCAVSLNVLCSLGGGTGSGLGTRMIERINEQFSIDVLAHVILPNRCGETPLQFYNCALSLSRIQENCSAIFSYENEKMIELMMESEEKAVGSLQKINEYISGCMSSLFGINDLGKYGRFYNELTSQCVLSPQAKYLSLTASSSSSWETTLENIFHQLKILTQPHTPTHHKLLQAQLLLIGSSQSSFSSVFAKKYQSLLHPLFETSFNWDHAHRQKSAIVGRKQKEVEKEECEGVLVMNHSTSIEYLEYLVERGRQKLEAKAYLWHFEEANIEESFDRLEDVITQYRQALLISSRSKQKDSSQANRNTLK